MRDLSDSSASSICRLVCGTALGGDASSAIAREPATHGIAMATSRIEKVILIMLFMLVMLFMLFMGRILKAEVEAGVMCRLDGSIIGSPRDLAAIAGADRPPDGQIDCVDLEPHGAVDEADVDAAGMLALGRRRDASRRKHA